MKSLRSLLLLAAPALLLVGCDQGATSSSPSVSPSESETPSEITTPSQSEPSSTPIEETPLDAFINGIKAGNYVYSYDDGFLGETETYTYTYYCLDESTVVAETDYGEGYVEYSLTGNNDDYGMVEVYFDEDMVYSEGLVTPAKGLNFSDVYYTPLDFVGDASDWKAEGSAYVSTSTTLKTGVLSNVTSDEDLTADGVGDLVLTLGDQSGSIATTIEGAALVFNFTNIGTAAFEGAADMLDEVELNKPTDWGMAAMYAEQFGIAFPNDYFGYGFTVGYDYYYGGLLATDTTADASKFLSLMQGLLADAGFVIDEEYSYPSEKYYSYSKGDYYVDFFWYTAEEMGSLVYPNGQVAVDFYTLGYQ